MLLRNSQGECDARETRWKARERTCYSTCIEYNARFCSCLELLYARNVVDDEDRVRDNASHYRLVLVRMLCGVRVRGV